MSPYIAYMDPMGQMFSSFAELNTVTVAPGSDESAEAKYVGGLLHKTGETFEWPIDQGNQSKGSLGHPEVSWIRGSPWEFRRKTWGHDVFKQLYFLSDSLAGKKKHFGQRCVFLCNLLKFGASNQHLCD